MSAGDSHHRNRACNARAGCENSSKEVVEEAVMPPSILASTLPAEYTGYASSQDASVNWDRPAAVGRMEARYVRRCPDYFVVYLSSQTGCNQGCRMCHLTATGQTRLRDATLGEKIDQARTVLDHYRREGRMARSVHFNFMARGEP